MLTRASRVLHHPAGKAPVLLNTSSCPAPNYWPDSTADATALAQALRQAAEQEAAARKAGLSEQQLLSAAEARRLEPERQAAVTAAAQADKQVRRAILSNIVVGQEAGSDVGGWSHQLGHDAQRRLWAW